jgi:phosphate transport system permease protein
MIHTPDPSDLSRGLTNRIAVRPGAAMRGLKDGLFRATSACLGFVVVFVIVWIGYRLFVDSAVTRNRYGIKLLTGSTWDVPHEIYGALPVIFGTLFSALLALCISVPLSVGAAVFLTEIAPKWLRTTLSFIIELLAAIPSVIYGLWGFLVLCPLLQSHVSPWLADHLGANPFFSGPPELTNMLAAGMILAIMVMPIITSISKEVLQTVPVAQRDASMGLGATKWETIKHVILPEAKSGITGAVILGLGRAIGETMAVVMVIGNSPRIEASILKAGYTMPALLANTFNEAYNDDLQRSALLEVALILFAITFAVNGLARLILLLTSRELNTSAASGPSLVTRLRTGFEAAVRLGSRGVVFAFVGIQAWFDFHEKGFPGLVGPVEMIAVVLVASQLFAAQFGTTQLAGTWRKVANRGMHLVLTAAAFVACFVLGALLIYVAVKGASGLSLNLFTQLPHPAGIPGGGLKNSIIGTIELVGIAAMIGVPIGLMGGIFAAEFGKKRGLGAIVRYAADVLNGIPSVVIGLFAYAAFVLPFKHFSGWAGGGALAIMMIPTIMRTTEEMLKLVPNSFREGAMALGASKVKTIITVIVPAARSGIVTGILLGTARVAGETAPLLFTAFGSDHMAVNPSEQTSTLTMKIYEYAVSPNDDWVSQAWAGALVLLLLILSFNIIARLGNRTKYAAA